MKRRNLLANILNIITQIACIIWFFAYSSLYFDFNFHHLAMGAVILGITIIPYLIVVIINFIIGILNKKKSVAKLVLYIINSILFLIQPILLYIANEEYEDYLYIILILVHISIYFLTMTLFILNRKTAKSTESNKKLSDTMIFSTVTAVIIIVLVIPIFYKISLHSKIKSIANDSASLPKYVIGKKENGETDIIDENGDIVTTIKDEFKSGICYMTLKDEKKAYTILTMDREKGTIKLLDVKDVKNIKCFYEAKLVNKEDEYLSMADLAGIAGIDKYGTDEYSGILDDKYKEIYKEVKQKNGLYEIERQNDFSKFEDIQGANYSYYQNGETLLQVVQINTNTLDSVSGNLKDANKREYYLIKQDEKRKIKLDCKKLITGKDELLGTEYIYIYNQKYIPFIDVGTNGYFNLSGEKVEVNNTYIYIDIDDEAALVAKVKEEDKNKAKRTTESTYIEEDELYEGKVELVLVNKEKHILSDAYSEATILNDFYILGNTNETGYTCSLWNKNGKELIKETNASVGIFKKVDANKVAIAKIDSDILEKMYELYDKNGKIEGRKYMELENNIDTPYSTAFPMAYQRYMNILSQMD